MSGILKSWIRLRLKDALSSAIENPVRLGQHQRVQIMSFLTYESPVFAEVSDMETFISCEFTQDCVEAYQTEFGKRFTQIKGAYLTLKNMLLKIYETLDFSVSVRLIVQQIQFLGGEGEAIVGNPVPFTEYPEIRNLLRSSQIQGFLWPQLSVEQEGIDTSPEIKPWFDSDKPSDGFTETFTLSEKVKKRGFWSTYVSKDEWDKGKKKQRRFLHPGWRGFFEITYQDCIISDDQRKILEQDESWYPPIKSSHHENIQTEDNNFTPKTRKINKENVVM